jgi:threonine dehydratase
MHALGVNLVEHGEDFQAAREYAEAQAEQQGLHMIPAIHPLLVTGVATYSLEFLRAVPDLDVVYVPIGMGSGACGMIAARNALGLKTKIVGVVSAHAPTYARSFEARKPLSQPVATRLADGMAVRTPDPQALEILLANVDHLVEVTDAEIAASMRTIFECIHHVAEGAGAASLAAAMQERGNLAGRRVGTVLSGANVDREVFARVLSTT